MRCACSRACFLTLALALTVEYVIGWARLIEVWRYLDPIELGFAFAAVLASYLMRGARIAIWLRHRVPSAATAPTLANCTTLFLRHNLVNVLLPFRTGEIAFPMLLNAQFGIALGTGVTILLWLRALDLAALATFGCCAIVAAHFGPIAGVAALVCSALFFLSLPQIINAIATTKILRQLPERIRTAVTTLLESPPHKSAWLWVVALSLGNWLVKLFSFAFVLSILVDCSLPIALGGAIGAELSTVLPTHGVAGAGSYEAGSVAALMAAGVAFAPALAGTVNLHFFMLACALSGGIAAYLAPAPSARPSRRASSATAHQPTPIDE